MGKAADSKRKVRRHSPSQLHHRPVTVKNCGPVKVSAEFRGRQVVVVIEHADGATIEQPPAEGMPLEAISVTETDELVPDKVLVKLLKNEAIKMARLVEFV